MSKESNTRLKIYLVKDENVDDLDLIKDESSSRSIKDYEQKSLYNDVLYYKKSINSVPKWYKEFLQQTDGKVFSASVSAFFFHDIFIKDKKIKFAIVFGGGDNALNLEKFDDSFGLRIALNLADEFLNIKKDNISTTQSKTREQAVRGQRVTSFGIDFEKDMLNGVTVKPKNNNISVGNISGAMSVSIALPITYSDLDRVLVECYNISQLDDYQKEFPYINNIKEIKQDKTLISELKNIIVKLFNDKEEAKVWLSVPEFIDWTDTINYDFSWGRSNNPPTKKFFDVNSTNAYSFIEFYQDVININDFSDFKKIKITPHTVSGRTHDSWTLEDCLYAHIEYNNKEYVYNNKRFYQVNSDYVKRVNESFNKLGTIEPLMDFTETKPENLYIKDVCNGNDDYVLMDQKLEQIQTKIEICDIFDKKNKRFIHIKKYGSSAVLSHLFSQAFVSADIFADKLYSKKIIDRLIQEDNAVENDIDKTNYSVTIAIITKENVEIGKHANLPFFSKVNLVSTVDKIQKIGYKNVDVMYIHSTTDLYNKKK